MSLVGPESDNQTSLEWQKNILEPQDDGTYPKYVLNQRGALTIVRWGWFWYVHQIRGQFRASAENERFT